ncbi:MAG TPA: serine hydrolase [Chloroflexia bacterium]|nr:serine hydrolase [Chloroflexia bacterium]
MTLKGNQDTSKSIEIELSNILRLAGCDGYLYAMDIDSQREVGLNPHQIVVAASVFKVAVALELYRQAAVEGLDVTAQVKITEDNRTAGPTGLSNGQDIAFLSLRDLASLMLSISDNTATDILIAKVGLAQINSTLQTLGLHHTVIVNDLRNLIASITADAEVSNLDELWSMSEEKRDERLARCRALHPEQATRTTPFEMAYLLRSIWCDEVSPVACAEVRRLMAQQASTGL